MVPLLSDIVARTVPVPPPSAGQSESTQVEEPIAPTDVVVPREEEEMVVVQDDVVIPEGTQPTPADAVLDEAIGALVGQTQAEGSMHPPVLTGSAPLEARKAGRRRNGRKKNKDKVQDQVVEQTADEEINASFTESGSETESQMSLGSQADVPEGTDATRQRFRNLESLLSSSKDRTALALKRKSDQESEQEQQRYRRLSLTPQVPPPPAGVPPPDSSQVQPPSAFAPGEWANDGEDI